MLIWAWFEPDLSHLTPMSVPDVKPRQADSMPLIMYGRTSLSILASLGLTNLQLLQARWMQMDADGCRISWYFSHLLLGWLGASENLTPIAHLWTQPVTVVGLCNSRLVGVHLWLSRFHFPKVGSGYDVPSAGLCHALPRARFSWRLCFCCMRRMVLCCREFSRPGRQMSAVSKESMWCPDINRLTSWW